MRSELVNQLFELGKVKGFVDQEIYYVENKNIEISVYEGQIDKYNISEDGGLSYRGIVGGKLGYAYTERFEASTLEMLVNEAYENAKAF